MKLIASRTAEIWKLVGRATSVPLRPAHIEANAVIDHRAIAIVDGHLLEMVNIERLGQGQQPTNIRQFTESIEREGANFKVIMPGTAGTIDAEELRQNGWTIRRAWGAVERSATSHIDSVRELVEAKISQSLLLKVDRLIFAGESPSYRSVLMDVLDRELKLTLVGRQGLMPHSLMALMRHPLARFVDIRGL